MRGGHPTLCGGDHDDDDGSDDYVDEDGDGDKDGNFDVDGEDNRYTGD